MANTVPVNSSSQATVEFYDTKPYDGEFFNHGISKGRLHWRFHPFCLNSSTAGSASGAFAVCVFVHDIVDTACLEILKASGVQVIALRCAGYNFVDYEAAGKLGIDVVRVPAYSPSAVAEHTVALLLSLNRKLHRAYNRIREHNFSLAGLVGFDVTGKTVGIIGCGKIGKKVAQIFRGFEARVLAYDPRPDPDWAQKYGVEFCPLSDLYRDSDIVSLHLPLVKETEYLLHRDTFAKMKRGVYVINTSRGKLINTGDLIDALQSGQVAGVALDVYEEEDGLFFEDKSQEILDDPKLAYLLTFPNVIVTAHQAFLTREALSEIARVTTANLLAKLDGLEYLPGTKLMGG